MSLVSVSPGQTVNTVLKLPKPATATVKWSVWDHDGRLVVKGQTAPLGLNVTVAFVMPSDAVVPPDKSRYRLIATDGTTSAVEYFEVVAPYAEVDDHGIEVTYMKGRAFTDTLVLPEPADEISVQVVLMDGTSLTTVLSGDPNDFVRRGASYVYSIDAGVLDTRTAATFGVGSVIWDYTLASQAMPQQEIHPFYTMTPYASAFTNDIRKLIDRARMGDANPYMKVTVSDLLHALTRGADYVMQAAPLATGFPLDQMPIMLKDYIVKAGTVDVLRSLYLAEGSSAHDMQGLGVQLNIDRTQYFDGMINSLNSDLEKLTDAKKKWLEQGAPLGSEIRMGRRPIGMLHLTQGTYSNFPMLSQKFRLLSTSFYSWTIYGSLV